MSLESCPECQGEVTPGLECRVCHTKGKTELELRKERELKLQMEGLTERVALLQRNHDGPPLRLYFSKRKALEDLFSEHCKLKGIAMAPMNFVGWLGDKGLINVEEALRFIREDSKPKVNL